MIADCGVPARSDPKQMGRGGGDKADRGNERGKKKTISQRNGRHSFIHVTRYCCDDYRGDGDRTIVERAQ